MAGVRKVSGSALETRKSTVNGASAVSDATRSLAQAPPIPVSVPTTVQNQASGSQTQEKQKMGATPNKDSNMASGRKPSNASTIAPTTAHSNASVNNAATKPAQSSGNATTGPAAPSSRFSRLTAPTASSLAKVNASSTVKNNVAGNKGPGTKPGNTQARVSKIPVMSPTNKSIKKPASAGAGINAGTTPASKKIFSKPLNMPTSPATRSVDAGAAGGAGPSLMGIASSIAADMAKNKDAGKPAPTPTSSTTTKGDTEVVRKPRISRSKIKERLRGTAGGGMTSPTPSVRSPLGKSAATNGSHTQQPSTPSRRSFKTRSSVGKAKVSLGKAGAGAGAGGVGAESATGVLMSAKKRARASEAARRRSAKTAGSRVSVGGESMEVDD
jgi:hypothetical protein